MKQFSDKVLRRLQGLWPTPIAIKVPHWLEIHGNRIYDNFHWMKQVRKPGESLNPRILSHLKEENDYTDVQMAHTYDLQKTLVSEMRARLKEDDSTVPCPSGRFLYYTRMLKGKQYGLVCRRPIAKSGREQILLDENKMAKGHKFFSLVDYVFSPNHKLVAYMCDTTGDRRSKLYVKNLTTKEVLEPIADYVTSVTWCSDNRTLFYVTEDPLTKHSNKLWRHKLGSKRHTLVNEESDQSFSLEVQKNRSGKFIYLVFESHITSAVSFIPADKPLSEFRLIAKRKLGTEYSVEDDGENFYILTNDGAKDKRLMRTSCDSLNPENWQEIVPHRPGVLVNSMDIFADHIVLFETNKGIPKVRVQKVSTGEVHYVEFPEQLYDVEQENVFEFNASKIRLRYQSMVSPAQVWEYDLDTKTRTILKQDIVPGYDASQYHSARIYATARDGTHIPVSLVYKGDLVKDGSRPCLLYGYGAYGLNYTADFCFKRLSLLDRGVIYAIAHIRGGSEMGETWHEQGKMEHKMNTFTDFIDCAEMLKDRGYTSTQKMAMGGRSAGGLLMGAVLNLKPDLVKAAFVGVPFVDVINTMLDTSIPLTVDEFTEWGNPALEKYFEIMMDYSPYDNIRSGVNYPAILVEAAVEDTLVPYWEAAKWVAKIRHLNPPPPLPAKNNPVLLKMQMDGAGHGGSSGRFDALKEESFRYAFLLWQLGITK